MVETKLERAETTTNSLNQCVNASDRDSLPLFNMAYT